MSNSFDPDQAQQNVGPDQDLDGLQRLSAGDKCRKNIKYPDISPFEVSLLM